MLVNVILHALFTWGEITNIINIIVSDSLHKFGIVHFT